MAKQCMLTTIDNPFNPFEDFDSWFLFDMEKGYNSCGRLMRVANIPDDLTESEEDGGIESAVDTIIRYDFMNSYTKGTNDNADKAS